VETLEHIARANKDISEYLHLLANEPSIGLYHVQEHIRRSVPKLVQMKTDLKQKCQVIDEASFDVDYTLLTVKSLHGMTTFGNVKAVLDAAIQTTDSINRGNAFAAKLSPTSSRPPTTSPAKPLTPRQQQPNIQQRQFQPSSPNSTELSSVQPSDRDSTTPNQSISPHNSISSFTSFDTELGAELTKFPISPARGTRKPEPVEFKPKVF